MRRRRPATGCHSLTSRPRSSRRCSAGYTDPSGRSNTPPECSRSAEITAYPWPGARSSTLSRSRSRWPFIPSLFIPRDSRSRAARRQSRSLEGVPPRRARSTSRDPLATYRRKRDFTRTPEPAGGMSGAPDDARRFVVQRHRARRLHYELRFEIDGVLVSWAVPKGPTLDAGVRRAAFHVEDHPIEYFDFEGVIPAGEYGGGDVIVWDAGTWEAYKEADPWQAVRDGELHAELHGEKLRGRFVLVRTSRADSDQDEWLLLHKHDDFAVEGWDAEDHPRSVLSGRTNDEVKADPDRMWRSDLPAARASILLKTAAIEPAGEDELAELEALKGSGTWAVFGRELRVTNLDKELFPARSRREKPVTKRELLRYAAQIAPTILPYLSRRALNMHR